MAKTKKDKTADKWKPFMKKYERFEEMDEERKKKFLDDIVSFDIKDKDRPS